MDQQFNELSEGERADILSRLCATQASNSAKKCGPEFIEAVSHLDPSEQEHFQPIVKACIDEMERQHFNEKLNRKPKDRENTDEGKNMKAPKAAPSEPASSSSRPPARIDPAADSLPPAQVKLSAGERAAPTPGRKRKGAPEELKRLLPPVPGLYLKWFPEKRSVGVEFSTGQGFEWVVQSSNYSLLEKRLLARLWLVSDMTLPVPRP